MVVSFGHADPAVQPTAQFGFAGVYLPGLQKALLAVQDADACLLGLATLPRWQDRISMAMASHRAAVLPLRRLLQAGGRP